MNSPGPIRSVAVFGDGIVGASAALAFAQALPGASVQLIGTPVAANALCDRMPGSLPGIRHFHRLVGIDEMELVKFAGSTHRTGTKFSNWGALEEWFHCFGTYGTQVHASPFHHQWLRFRCEGIAANFDRYAPVTALARAGKFVHPVDDQQSLLASFDYALRFDPMSYRDLLLGRARQARVTIRTGEVAEARKADDGSLSLVVLHDGSSIKADLFIDCTGPAALLLSVVGSRFESWAGTLPFDTFDLEIETAGAASPVDHATATAGGFRLCIPLGEKTLVISASSSSLPQNPLEGAERIGIASGVRPDTWVHNVLAFGDAAAVVDPLESTNLYLAQNSIRRAVTLIPETDFNKHVLREYNRRTRAEAERVRDFIAAHYLATAGAGATIWSRMPRVEIPESLRHTMQQFMARGRLPKFEEETFQDDSWLAVLLGLGMLPGRLDPTACRVSAADSEATLERVARLSEELPLNLPAYEDYLRTLRAS